MTCLVEGRTLGNFNRGARRGAAVVDKFPLFFVRAITAVFR